MHPRRHTFLQRAGELLGAAVLGAAIWYLALLAANEYNLRQDIDWAALGRILRDYAVLLGVLIAALTFAFNSAHQRRTIRRDRERLTSDMAIEWLRKALEVAGEVFEESTTPKKLYLAAPSFQIDTIATLLSSAHRKAADLCELELVDRFGVEASFARAKLLQMLRFRGTAEFFDFHYYEAALLAAGDRSLTDNNSGGLSVAAFHNISIDLLEKLDGKIADLQIPDETKRDLRHLQMLLDGARNDRRPFSHPYFGSSVPLESTETILRFAVGKMDLQTDLADILDNRDSRDSWFLDGLYVLLYQAKYFRTRPDGRVYNINDPVQVAKAIAAGAPNPTAPADRKAPLSGR